MPWPFPGDSAVTRARKVALGYRQAALDPNPAGAVAVLDAKLLDWGEHWAVPRPDVYADEDRLTPAQAADLACVSVAHIRMLRRRGRLPGQPINGGRSYVYRAGDVYALLAVRRRGRSVSDTLPANGTAVPAGPRQAAP